MGPPFKPRPATATGSDAPATAAHMDRLKRLTIRAQDLQSLWTDRAEVKKPTESTTDPSASVAGATNAVQNEEVATDSPQVMNMQPQPQEQHLNILVPKYKGRARGWEYAPQRQTMDDDSSDLADNACCLCGTLTVAACCLYALKIFVRTI